MFYSFLFFKSITFVFLQIEVIYNVRKRSQNFVLSTDYFILSSKCKKQEKVVFWSKKSYTGLELKIVKMTIWGFSRKNGIKIPQKVEYRVFWTFDPKKAILSMKLSFYLCIFLFPSKCKNKWTKNYLDFFSLLINDLKFDTNERIILNQ